MKNKIPFKRILQQLKADLIGKDSYRGVTLTYAWLANQFGHISLGFIPSFLVYYLLNLDALKAALYVSAFWFLFELYNFLGPLLSKKESNSDVLFIQKKVKYIFSPKWFNVAFDTFTDVCFFIVGSFLFAFCIYKFNNNTIIIILAVLSIYLAFATRYWYVTKMYQFYARFPFQFRLSQWDFTINSSDKLKVENFLDLKNTGNHLLLFGSLGAGKTSLGVGILNELSIKNNSCLYVNAIKMFNYFFKDEGDVLESHEIWNWKTVDFLMIDDINPSEPIQDELISPTKLLSFIDTLKLENKKNREILKNKNIIWVLGNKQPLDEKNKDDWKEMLLNIGVEEQKITTINL
ncbi:IstB-like ATP binding protein [Polaribacter sp. KT25b]|uniref:ATP-binding protein n=1 Tax=Polaribacter sp. KT25b TaxID=1855336 RepID=UPI00087BCC11|nr:ATP-binding protein [Polaribacter sp. KT25b]SDR67295.1 IstB-like ATP binding protein [Polaribacter sp. KT25b]